MIFAHASGRSTTSSYQWSRSARRIRHSGDARSGVLFAAPSRAYRRRKRRIAAAAAVAACAPPPHLIASGRRRRRHRRHRSAGGPERWQSASARRRAPLRCARAPRGPPGRRVICARARHRGVRGGPKRTLIPNANASDTCQKSKIAKTIYCGPGSEQSKRRDVRWP